MIYDASDFAKSLLPVHPKQVNYAVAGTAGEVAAIEGEGDAADAGGRQLQFTAFLVGRETPEDDVARCRKIP